MSKELQKMAVKDYLAQGYQLPEFQRGTSWTVNQYKLLMETITKDGIIPSFAIGTVDGVADSFIIDGRQRTEALVAIIKELEKAANSDNAEEKAKALELLEKVYNFELVLIIKQYQSVLEMAHSFTLLNNGTPLTATQRLRPNFKPQILKLFEMVKTSNLADCFQFKNEKEKTKWLDDISIFFIGSLFTHLSGEKKGISTASTNSTTAIKLATERSWTDEAFLEITAKFDSRLNVLVNALAEYRDNEKLTNIVKRPKSLVQLFMFTNTEECANNSGNICDLVDLLWDNDGKVLNTQYKVKDGRKYQILSPVDFMGGDSRGNDNASTLARFDGIVKIWNAEAQPITSETPKMEMTDRAVEEAVNGILGVK